MQRSSFWTESVGVAEEKGSGWFHTWFMSRVRCLLRFSFPRSCNGPWFCQPGTLKHAQIRAVEWNREAIARVKAGLDVYGTHAFSHLFTYTWLIFGRLPLGSHRCNTPSRECCSRTFRNEHTGVRAATRLNDPKMKPKTTPPCPQSPCARCEEGQCRGSQTRRLGARGYSDVNKRIQPTRIIRKLHSSTQFLGLVRVRVLAYARAYVCASHSRPRLCPPVRALIHALSFARSFTSSFTRSSGQIGDGKGSHRRCDPG
jgi:hypothetical protein